jgi:predicted nucleic acid-binding protein
VSAELLLDNSAWTRLNDPRIPEDRAEEIAAAIEQGRAAVCLPFLLEAGYSARSGDEHDQLVDDLLALPFLSLDEDIEHRAIEAQGELAHIGHHRLPPVDLLVAAIAAHYGIGVLHYDGDFDLIRSKTSLEFESVWLVPRGTL